MAPPQNTLNDTVKSSGSSPRPIVEIENMTIYRGIDSQERFEVIIEELVIPSGMVVAIVGESGYGKSSLLSVVGLMRGYRKDKEFRVKCKKFYHYYQDKPFRIYSDGHANGNNNTKTADQIEELRRQSIGFCLQGGELIPSMSLLDNAAVTGFLCGHSSPSATAASFLEQLKLHDKKDKFPNELSGGQKQRGVVARALVHKPSLILLDEPTSALDRRTAEKTLELLRNCTREGQTVLLVTHSPTLAKQFADFIIKMDNVSKGKGKVVKQVYVESVEKSEREISNTVSVQTWKNRIQRRKLNFLNYLVTYTRIGLMDALGPLFRLKRLFPIRNKFFFINQVAKNSVVLTAIGLLILILMGMRSGLIENFRKNLTKSPTGRELKLTSRSGIILDDAYSLKRNYPEVEQIIPVVKGLVIFLDESCGSESAINVNITTNKDPLLSMVYDTLDFSTFDDNSLILSRKLSKELGLKIDDWVQVWVTRAVDKDDNQESGSAELRLSQIIDSNDEKVGYISIAFSEQINRFKKGLSVPERNWKGFKKPITPLYSEYLMACKRKLSVREEKMMGRQGMVTKEIPASDPVFQFMGLARETPISSEPSFYLYRVYSGRDDDKNRWMNINIQKLEPMLTDSDAILIPWPQPRIGRVENENVLVIGASGRFRWLRKYLDAGSHYFSLEDEGWKGSFGASAGANTEEKSLQVLSGDENFAFPVILSGNMEKGRKVPQLVSGTEKELPVLSVPASFLARIDMVQRGIAKPDQDHRIFTSVDEKPYYYNLRVYVEDVYEVLKLEEAFKKDFLVLSNSHRISEMKRYAETLHRIVTVISLFALVIAVITAFLVFKDVGESKKRMIATLRIMGLGKAGVYILMIVRGIFVSAVAALFLVGSGAACSFVLNYSEDGTCLLGKSDYGIVIAGVMAACIVSVLWTSWNLVKLDPVAAFEEAGKLA